MTAKIICAFNNQEIFDKVVKNNESIKNCQIFVYDNTVENISITKRYNDFIDANVLLSCNMINMSPHPTPPPQGREGEKLKAEGNKDFWCVFIHQDFGFMGNLELAVEKLDKDCIHGVIGAKVFKGLFFGKKEDNKFGFKTSLKLIFGSILQGNNDFNFKKYGLNAFLKPTVDSVDCCCVMIHSSLIKKYNLRFDENLGFHLYAEELCYRAKMDYKIKTKIAQINCFHLGRGVLNEDFYAAAQYLKEKFKIEKIPSTCPN